MKARNRGVMLITGAFTHVTWLVTLVTRLCMCKNGNEAPGHSPGQDAVGASWRQGVGTRTPLNECS